MNEEGTTVVANPKTGKLEKIDLHTGEEIFIQEKDIIPYSTTAAKAFCSFVREGMTMTKAAKQIGMSYSSVSHWRHRHPDFDEAIKAARLERAEIFHDRIIEETENLKERDDVAVVKTKIDSYKWLAEKNNPASFGNKTHVVGDSSITIIVDTGVGNIEPVTVEGECYEQSEEQDTEQRRDVLDPSESGAERGGEAVEEPESPKTEQRFHSGGRQQDSGCEEKEESKEEVEKEEES